MMLVRFGVRWWYLVFCFSWLMLKVWSGNCNRFLYWSVWVMLFGVVVCWVGFLLVVIGVSFGGWMRCCGVICVECSGWVVVIWCWFCILFVCILLMCLSC